MSEVRQQLFEIVASMSRGKTPSQVATAQTFEELNMDSIGMMAALDEIEEKFGIKLPEDPDFSISVPDFLDLIEGLISAHNA